MAERTKTGSIALLKRLWTDGVHIDEIARQMGCGRYHVYDLCRKHGIPKRSRATKEPELSPLEIKQRARHCRIMRALGKPIGGK